MKFKQTKRIEALERLKESRWVSSKALWEGTQTKENWLKQKEARIEQLEAAIRKGV